MEQSSRRHSSTGNSVKLPKLEIPSYSGEKLKWAEFWDSFEAAADLNKGWSGGAMVLGKLPVPGRPTNFG